jgi:hypothetical protein
VFLLLLGYFFAQQLLFLGALSLMYMRVLAARTFNFHYYKTYSLFVPA